MKYQDLKHSELTFRLIVESTPSSILLVNKEGKIAYANTKSEILFGYKRSELIGQHADILIPKRYHKNYPGLRKIFFKPPAKNFISAAKELFASRKDGTEFPIEIGLNPIVTTDGTMVSASITDITERKKAEERFRLVVESAPNAMLVVTNEGNITLINIQAEKLFGYTRKELIGSKFEMLIPGGFRSHQPGPGNAPFKNPGTKSTGLGKDFFAVRKCGKEIPVEIGLNPIETNEGDIVLASVIDITVRKMQESIIKEQVTELEIKNKELEHFTYIVSHDLQEPLRTVSNYLQIFREDYSEKLDQNALKYLNTIDSATKRMTSLVRGLLDFSFLGNDKTLVNLDCGKIIDEVLADLGILIKTSNAEIKVGEMPILAVYETEMRQLFQNLISNAIKFQEKGKQPKIDINAEKVDGRWKFSVTDNGIGVAAKDYEKIFHIFRRLENNSSYEGNGIGLANCKKIVELHKGKIWIESIRGKGTTFYFTI